MIKTAEATAADPARFWLQVLDTVDVCGRRECVLVVAADPISARDSLMGFNLAIRFNPEKLVFHTMLTIGTLAEAMEWRDLGVRGDELRAYAFTLASPVFGAKPLVAFLGEYRHECPDTTAVQLAYVEFNEEFERQRSVVVDTAPVPVVAAVRDMPGRVLQTRLQERHWEISGTDTVATLTAVVEYDTTLRLGEAVTEMDGLPSWLAVDTVTVVGGILQGWERSGHGVTVRWASQGRVQVRFMMRVTERVADTALVRVETRPVNPCACLTRWSGDSLRAVNTARDTVPTHVVQVQEQRWYERSSLLCLEAGERLELYDLQGRLCWREEAREGRRCVQLAQLSEGVYIGLWQRRGGSVPTVFLVQSRSVEFAR